MEITYRAHLDSTSEQDASLVDQLRAMLRWADNQFVPPLSARHSSTQTDLSPAQAANDHMIEDYLKALLDQRFLLALEDGELAGFMSFRLDYPCEYVPDDRCTYVSTIIVAEQWRGHQLTEQMYQELFRLPEVAGTQVTTRTWSKNQAHLTILRRQGFDLVKTLPDDRGPGIDTVYYARKA